LFWSAFQRQHEDEEEGARERAGTQGDSKKTRGREEKLEEKRKSDEVEDEGRPSSFFLGVARVHLIYQTLRNVEGTTLKLNHYPSEAPALRRVLQPRVASCDAPALRPYKLRCFLTTLRRFFTMF